METKTLEATPVLEPVPMLLPVLSEGSTANLPVVVGAMAIQSPDSVTPVRPEHITDERDAELKAQAKTIADAILADPSDVNITAQVFPQFPLQTHIYQHACRVIIADVENLQWSVIA